MREQNSVSNEGTQEILIAPDFANRLKKNFNKIGKWAKREGLDCFRLYDADLPEYNVAIDVYQDHLMIQEYAAPKDIPEEKAKRRLTDIIRAAIQVLDVDANNVVLKVRERLKRHVAIRETRPASTDHANYRVWREVDRQPIRLSRYWLIP